MSVTSYTCRGNYSMHTFKIDSSISMHTDLINNWYQSSQKYQRYNILKFLYLLVRITIMI